MGNRAFIFNISVWMMLLWTMAAAAWAEEGPSVVVHFDNGQSFLSTNDKAKLRTLFQGHAIGPQSRVFVLGYTDARGDNTVNYRLSRKRAQSVRREIVSSFAIDATIVMAMGKGEENPVADNRKARGRALNRRAEIYLANTPVRTPPRVYGPKDPHLPNIERLVAEAEALLKQQQLNDAIRKLEEARTMGGDHYSDWHAAYGISGYYANAPHAKIEGHFEAAVRLDPYNYKAREFLGRVQARRKVADGEVSEKMGRTAATAIAVTSVAQEHEYLRLFEVEPLNHREVEKMPVDVWECLDAAGGKVVYYFNHVDTYAWAFGHQDVSTPTRPDAASAPPLKSTPADWVVKTENQSPPDTVAPAIAGDPSPNPRQIWESRVFQ